MLEISLKKEEKMPDNHNLKYQTKYNHKLEPQTKHNCKSKETEKAVASLGETGSEILDRLAEGESFGGVIGNDDEEEDDKSNVVEQDMEIEMEFDD